MKKILKMFIFLFFVFGVCACNKADEVISKNKEGKFIELTTIESKDYVLHTEREEYKTSDERILILFQKKDGENFKFYEPYNIFKRVDNEWILLSFKNEVYFSEQEISVNKTEESINNIAEGFQYIYFSDLNSKITDGTYKVVKEFEGKIASYEFTIKS